MKEVQYGKVSLQELSDRVLGLAFRVKNILGPGLLESVYEKALCAEFEDAGFFFERQKCCKLMYRGRCIGQYYADLVVENCILLELKSVSSLTRLMEAQLLSNLKLSGLKVGYLMNFNSLYLEWKRMVI